MNLIEVLVASALFLAACSGAAQMGASSAQAMTQGRRQGQLQEQVGTPEKQLASPLASSRRIGVMQLEVSATEQPAVRCPQAVKCLLERG